MCALLGEKYLPAGVMVCGIRATKSSRATLKAQKSHFCPEENYKSELILYYGKNCWDQYHYQRQDIGVMVHIIFLFNSTICFLQKMKWILADVYIIINLSKRQPESQLLHSTTCRSSCYWDYHLVNWQWINTDFGTRYRATDLAVKYIFFQFLSLRMIKFCCFYSHGKTEVHIYSLTHGYTNCPVLCHGGEFS